MSTCIGKKAEKKIQEWLDRPEDGYCFDRLKDQTSGFYGSKNICDFTLYKYPSMYYIESKATYNDRFDFGTISGLDIPEDTTCQFGGMLAKSKIPGVHSKVIVLFATQKRAFIIDINEIARLAATGKKSLNINKISNWDIDYQEIETIPNNRKQLLNYTGGWLC